MTSHPEHVLNATPIIVGLFVLLFYVVVVGLYVWAFCRIFAKAGYSWALGLLMLVPIANIIIAFYTGVRRLARVQGTSAASSTATHPSPVRAAGFLSATKRAS